MALRKRGVTFLICFRKRGYPEMRGRVLRKGGGASNPGGNYGLSLLYHKNIFDRK